RVLRGVGVADHRQETLDIRAIRIELRLEVGTEVVVAIRESNAGLSDEQGVYRWICRVRPDADANQRAAERAVGLTHETGERVLVGDGRNTLQVLLQRLVVQSI